MRWTECGQHRLRTQFAIPRLLAASTSHAALVFRRNGELQQLAQQGRTGMMHRRAHRHLDRFQIQPSAVAAVAQDHAEELLYFARDFLLDGIRRFFSCGESVSSRGRAWQIFSLISSKA